jgi:hypothetical protein
VIIFFSLFLMKGKPWASLVICMEALYTKEELVENLIMPIGAQVRHYMFSYVFGGGPVVQLENTKSKAL